MKNKNLILSAFGLLFSSSFTFGQIDLGTSANFAMFTSVGAFDNVGLSHFVGDIGTNVGAITGFPPGTLTGVIQQANPITLQAATDVENAYNYLTGVPCDSILGSALGAGQILTPYVYCIPSAAALNGELILDAEGNPNALFTIKITGLLDVIAFSKVTLINSASASNVYWQIDGAVNVYESVVFNGVILANGALGFADGSVLNGHGLTRAGAISTTSMSATIPSEVLSIELIKFEGEHRHTHNFISWSTASELNNSYFTVERTTDGINYIELIRINGIGTNSSTNSYTYADFGFEKIQNYYRLKQTDYDGEFEILGLIFINNFQAPRVIVKTLNMMGQEVDKDYTGLRIIYFNNGEIMKISGIYNEVMR